MKSQPTFKSSRFGQLLSAIFLLILLSLFAAGNVQAKKPVPEPAPVGLDNEAFWGDFIDSDILQDSARFCSLSQMAVDETSGTYSCALNSTEHILFDFSEMWAEPAHLRGDDWRCEPGRLFFHLNPDVQYSYSWNGSCAEGCDVKIVNSFTNGRVVGGSVDRITVEGFATAISTEENPFSEAQSLSIDYLHVTFFGCKGNNKVLAVCKYTPTTPVTFVTSPVELDP